MSSKVYRLSLFLTITSRYGNKLSDFVGGVWLAGAMKRWVVSGVLHRVLTPSGFVLQRGDIKKDLQ